MKETLLDIMKKTKIDIYGVCSPKVTIKYTKKVENIINKNNNCSFIKQDFLNNMSPYYYMEDVKSIIVIALPYHLNDKKMGQNKTMFSSSSWGEDYHKVILNKTKEIISKLELENPNYKFLGLVDNHNLDERYFASRAGIGFYGKHGMIINNKYGSNIFLGLILTNQLLEYNDILEKKCISCNKCIDKCPGKAISNEGVNYNKCISFLTQKKELSPDEENNIKDLVYGCDVCSKVCPHNKVNYGITSFKFDPNVEFDLDNEFIETNKSFKKKYGLYSGSWRGKNIIKRNLFLIKKNRGK